MHKITYKLDNIIDDLDKYIKIIMSNIMMQDIHKKTDYNNRIFNRILKDVKSKLTSRCSLIDYFEYISPLFSKKSPNSNTRFFYRGQYNGNYGLRSGVYRYNNFDKEDFLYHEMLVRCPNDFKNTTHLEKLTIMQHYGCPTRLLDITSNPLVALYFSCKNNKCRRCDNKDEGSIYIFDVDSNDMVYADSAQALILSCLPRFNKENKKKIFDIANKNIKKNCFPKNTNGQYLDKVIERLFYEISCEVPSFKRDIKPIDLLRPLYVQPDKMNNRILKQDGAFIISGLSSNRYEEQLKLAALSFMHLKIINKEYILKQLDTIGINEATLFPEIENVAHYLNSIK